MTMGRTVPRGPVWVLIAAAIGASLLAPGEALAGGLQLYEVGTEDVGLASAGYGARAQDASTVLTNPAGMTRLEDSQFLIGSQVLYGDLSFSLGPGSSAALGAEDGGNPVGWFPGVSLFYTLEASPKISFGIGIAGNFGLSEEYDSGWAGRYYAQKATLLGVSFLPSIAWKVSGKVSLGFSVNAMYGALDQIVAVNNPGGAVDGQLELDDTTWGWGVNVGVLYEPVASTRIGFTYNSQVKLDFSAPAEFSGLSAGLSTLLGNRGLLNADVDLGMYVPQGAMVSVFHQASDRWAVLGSVGWQQWSKFGKVDVGVDSSNPTSLTADLEFDDTWHAAVGAQYQMHDPWFLNLGVAYDSGFQDSSNVSPALPANAATRFGIGVQRRGSKLFSWGLAGEYAYGGTLDVNKAGQAPVAAGGRGNLVGSFDQTGIFFFIANFAWRF